jgi:hypothetical protein
VLENYLSRSVAMEGRNLKVNIRMPKSTEAKFIGRAPCLWNAENDFLNNPSPAVTNGLGDEAAIRAVWAAAAAKSGAPVPSSK